MLSTRDIKVDKVSDDFESIDDVRQSLQCFAKSSGLNVTANAAQLHSRPTRDQYGRSLVSCAPSSRGGVER